MNLARYTSLIRLLKQASIGERQVDVPELLKRIETCRSRLNDQEKLTALIFLENINGPANR
jgi:hypothetical protein